MNEQIFDHFLYMSGLTADGCWNNLGQYEKDAIKKFGELIVTHCAEVTDMHLRNYPITGALYDGLQSKRILNHFGMESCTTESPLSTSAIR